MKTTKKEQQILLTQFLGEEKANEVIKLTNAYDKYALRYKKKINELLAPINYEVLVGTLFQQKNSKEVTNGTDN